LLELEGRKERLDESGKVLEAKVKSIATDFLLLLGVDSPFAASPLVPVPSATVSEGQPRGTRRILREIAEIQQTPIEGWRVLTSEGDLLNWRAILCNVPFPFQGGEWVVSITLPNEYPLRPPQVRFETPILHPNIIAGASLPLDLLGNNNWSPAIKISSVLIALRTLVQFPDPSCHGNSPVAKLYLHDRSRYEREAQEHTQQHAVGLDHPS
jgi:ubiquitin-protein ligase